MNDNFNFKKSLGQNFLIDENVVNKIVDSINVGKNDIILEIGPGSGALTKKLKTKGCDLYAFEVDSRLFDVLNSLSDEHTHIVFNDFLNIDFRNFFKDRKYDKIFVIGNIPYYITNMIVKKIISEINAFEIVLMVQKEVAERYMAKCKSREYGSISVFLQYNFDIEIVCNVNRNCFNPMPNVDSTVIKFKNRNKEFVKDEKKFYDFIKNAFLLKRKTLKNNLNNYDFRIVEEYLLNNNISVSCRAEELSVIDFVNIFNLLN